jgi:hypothetical protein
MADLKVEKLVFKSIDAFLMNFFIGEARASSEFIMAKIKAEFWSKLMGGKEDSK